MTTRLSYPKTEADVLNLVDEVIASQNERNKQRTTESPSHTQQYLYTRIRSLFVSLLQNQGFSVSPEHIVLASVPKQHAGNFALNVPPLMKDMRLYREEILPKLRTNLLEQKTLPMELAEVVGPFLNFSIARHALFQEVLTEITQRGEHYGETTHFQDKRVIVEYSSPNMGKSLHVGHLGTTLLGQGLANIFQAAGATVFRVSHLGDWGTPCGMLEVGHEMYALQPEIAALRDRPSKYYSAIYSKFSEAQKERPELRERAKRAFAALEKGEPKAIEFWRTVREESAHELDALYERLGIHFDTFLGEAFYEPYLRTTITLLLEKGIARQDGEAIIVDLDDVGLKTVLLQKSDGATTYFARDVVALFKRKELFDYNLTLYVVGAEQTLHFRQLFEVGKRMGYLSASNADATRETKCEHVPIGLITQKGAKISSRAGGALGAEELQNAIYERAKSQVDESLIELEDQKRERIAQQLTNGALFFNQLLTAPGKSTEFNLDNILDMRGKSGAYLQYTCVRGRSILDKVGYPETPIATITENTTSLLHESSVTLLRDSLLFPDIVNQCCLQNSPHPLAHYLYSLAQEVNHFYQQVKIKDQEAPVQEAYLYILAGAVTVLANGMRLLNIEIPERM